MLKRPCWIKKNRILPFLYRNIPMFLQSNIAAKYFFTFLLPFIQNISIFSRDRKFKQCGMIWCGIEKKNITHLSQNYCTYLAVPTWVSTPHHSVTLSIPIDFRANEYCRVIGPAPCAAKLAQAFFRLPIFPFESYFQLGHPV